MDIKRILVPINGDRADEEAVRLACSLARRNKAKIYAVYVIEVERILPLDAEIQPEMRKAEEVLDKAEQMAEEEEYQMESEILQAREAGHAIVKEAVEKTVDLIVMGFTYKRRFGEFSLGTTMPYVMRNASCRVIVCREPVLSVRMERSFSTQEAKAVPRANDSRGYTMLPNNWRR